MNDAEVSQAANERRNGGLFMDAAGEFYGPEARQAYEDYYGRLTVEVNAEDLAAALATVDAVTDIRALSYDELAAKLIKHLSNEPGAAEESAWTQETLR